MNDEYLLLQKPYEPSCIHIHHQASSLVLSHEVRRIIDEKWEQDMTHAQEHGKILYNGDIWRLADMYEKQDALHLIIEVYTFKIRRGLGHMHRHIPEINAPKNNGLYSNSTIKTIDDWYIAVSLSGASMNPYQESFDLVGGIMEASQPLDHGQSLYNAYLEEFEEETALSRNHISNIILANMLIDRNKNICCYFKVDIKLTRKEVEKLFLNNTDPDIENLIFFKQNEYIEALNSHPSISKRMIAQLL